MRFLQLALAIFLLIVGLVGCGLFAVLEAVGGVENAPGHTTQTSALFTGIGLVAFLIWFVPIFLVVAIGVFVLKIVFFD